MRVLARARPDSVGSAAVPKPRPGPGRARAPRMTLVRWKPGPGLDSPGVMLEVVLVSARAQARQYPGIVPRTGVGESLDPDLGAHGCCVRPARKDSSNQQKLPKNAKHPILLHVEHRHLPSRSDSSIRMPNSSNSTSIHSRKDAKRKQRKHVACNTVASRGIPLPLGPKMLS